MAKTQASLQCCTPIDLSSTKPNASEDKENRRDLVYKGKDDMTCKRTQETSKAVCFHYWVQSLI